MEYSIWGKPEKGSGAFEQYGLKADPDALISDITVGMQQRVKILKMLYRENEALILTSPRPYWPLRKSKN